MTVADEFPLFILAAPPNALQEFSFLILLQSFQI